MSFLKIDLNSYKKQMNQSKLQIYNSINIELQDYTRLCILTINTGMIYSYKLSTKLI